MPDVFGLEAKQERCKNHRCNFNVAVYAETTLLTFDDFDDLFEILNERHTFSI